MLAMVIEQNVFDPAMQLNKIASWHTGYINSVPQTFFFFTINVLSFITYPIISGICCQAWSLRLAAFFFFNFFLIQYFASILLVGCLRISDILTVVYFINTFWPSCHYFNLVTGLYMLDPRSKGAFRLITSVPTLDLGSSLFS